MRKLLFLWSTLTMQGASEIVCLAAGAVRARFCYWVLVVLGSRSKKESWWWLLEARGVR